MTAVLPKFHLYISDTKVDEYFQQLPRSLLSKIAPDRFRLSALGIEIGIRRKGANTTKYEKLNAIISYLRETDEVGTPDAPKGYFECTLPMRSDMIFHDGIMVCYGAVMPGRSMLRVVVLAGSAHHVVGKMQARPAPERKLVHDCYSRDVTDIALAARRQLMQQSPTLEAAFAGRPLHEVQDDIHVLIKVADELPEPMQFHRFFAKTLYVANVTHEFVRGGKPTRVQFLLGTPFFVALGR